MIDLCLRVKWGLVQSCVPLACGGSRRGPPAASHCCRPHLATRSRIKRQKPLPLFRLQRVLRNVRQLPKLPRGTKPRKKTARRGHGWPGGRKVSGGDRNRTIAISFGKAAGRDFLRRKMRRNFGRPGRVTCPRRDPRGRHVDPGRHERRRTGGGRRKKSWWCLGSIDRGGWGR